MCFLIVGWEDCLNKLNVCAIVREGMYHNSSKLNHNNIRIVTPYNAGHCLSITCYSTPALLPSFSLRLRLSLSTILAIASIRAVAILRRGVRSIVGVLSVPIRVRLSSSLRLSLPLILCTVFSIAGVLSIPILRRRVAAIVGVLAVTIRASLWLGIALRSTVFAVGSVLSVAILGRWVGAVAGVFTVAIGAGFGLWFSFTLLLGAVLSIAGIRAVAILGRRVRACSVLVFRSNESLRCTHTVVGVLAIAVRVGLGFSITLGSSVLAVAGIFAISVLWWWVRACGPSVNTKDVVKVQSKHTIVGVLAVALLSGCGLRCSLGSGIWVGSGGGSDRSRKGEKGVCVLHNEGLEAMC